jgi:ribonuclease Z
MSEFDHASFTSMSGNWKLVFLGTASGQPSHTRNQSSLAISVGNQWYIFDVGEATLHQILKQHTLKLGRIRKIFITHLHGDHTFGLVGLLTSALQRMESHGTIELYGPRGLGGLVRNNLQSTYCKLNARFIIHELVEEGVSTTDGMYHHDEIAGTLIYPINGIWKVCEDEYCTILAARIEHTIPCVGYVLQEHEQTGTLLMDKLRPILNHYSVDYERMHVNLMSLLSDFKNGTPLSLPDGTKLYPKDFIGPNKRGRKIVILGDTSDPSAMLGIAMDPDVLIHEATNAFIPQSDIHSSLEQVQNLAIMHGHSTPQMAGQFARKIGAKMLILNHFSNRYRGDRSPDSIAIMSQVKNQAIEEFGRDQVVCAYDFFEYVIPHH